jgi:nitroreductase
VEKLSDRELSKVLGVHLQAGIEAEHADCMIALYPVGANDVEVEGRGPGLSLERLRSRLPDARFEGAPNDLSRDHHDWPVIEKVSLATRRNRSCNRTWRKSSRNMQMPPQELQENRGYPAERIVRQRRSAVSMDGTTWLDRDVFYQILRRTLPAQFPLKALSRVPRVALAIFVHRVSGLQPGLYLLVRNPKHEQRLRTALKPEFDWRKPDGCPDDLELYCLLVGDATRAATQIGCHQDIAGDGVFSLAMIAEYEEALALEGPDLYPRLFWETGLIGQVLYLEAEAAGIRGTGIGCFFDDIMHDLLGIFDRSWQSLYHFTVGGPVDDARLQTIAPYAHISSAR